MNENLDLTKILDGCPEGTKLYSTVNGEVVFQKVASFSCDYPITATAYNKNKNSMKNACFAKDGTYMLDYDGECVLFPSKEQRDWSKFERFWDKPKVEKVKKFNPKTLLPFEKILVRDDITQKWKADLFSYYDDETWKAFPINTVGNIHGFAIPYNEETKHLLGTTKEPNEYYKYWEE